MSDLILNSKKQPEQPNTARLMHSHRIQQGLSLIEISVVTVIVLLLAVLAVPAIQGYLVENRVPKVGEALAHYVLRQHLNASVHGANQYSGMNIQHFSRQNQDKAVFNIQGQGGQTVVNHGLGKDGELLVNELDGGRALELQLTGVHHAACPALATVLHQVADEIHIGATGGLVEVKSGQRTYNAFHAQQQCADGEVNTFKFVIR
ncbi:MAG TPA: prepilin-type N-terminal cleavage/methylation domain-containing protein [Paenalcaligenes sp.]|nr:prepilin-type N-terminal cleavage/methylation domain-containing protein [Paenalcaligenes sp.]